MIENLQPGIYIGNYCLKKLTLYSEKPIKNKPPKKNDELWESLQLPVGLSIGGQSIPGILPKYLVRTNVQRISTPLETGHPIETNAQHDTVFFNDGYNKHRTVSESTDPGYGSN